MGSTYAPEVRPSVAISPDGSLAAIAETGQVVVLELPSCSPFAEVSTDAEAGVADVAWVGTPPRLLVVSRFAARSTVHLLDPHGPRTIAELHLETPLRLIAAVGAHALAVGSTGVLVLATGESHLTPHQFPTRVVPLAAGAAGSQFVVALASGIEEWDPQNRMPKRRLKLPRPTAITAVGGSDRVVWLTTQQEPARIDVIPLVNRGQPRAHDLPEPIASVSGHPRSDLVVVHGANTGKLYALDLDGRTRLRVIATDGIDRVDAMSLVIGRSVGVLVAQAQRPLIFVPLDGRESPAASKGPAAATRADTEADPEPPKKSTLVDDTESDTPRPSSELASVLASAGNAAARVAALQRTPSQAPLGFTAPPEPEPRAVTSLAERFSARRERLREPRQADAPVATPAVHGRAALATERAIAAPASWRDDVAGWARSFIVDAIDREPPVASPIAALAERLELGADCVPALVLLYGAHLCGLEGAAPVEVSRVQRRQWDDALGRGALAAHGLAVYERSRVILAPAVQRLLDELPPASGTLVGSPGPIALLGPCAVIAPAHETLADVASRLGLDTAILAARDDAPIAAVIVEARIRGAVPMFRDHTGAIGRDVAIVVVEDLTRAEQLGVPRLA